MVVVSMDLTAAIFLGSIFKPSRLITWPRYSALVAKSRHLDAFIDRPAHLSRSKTFSSLSIICVKEAASRSACVSPSEVDHTPTSSKYGMHVSQARPCRAASIKRHMYDGPDWIPKGR